ncbi:short chain dehydrogenase/reductase SDR [Colletotrichum truncatum]|uniref:Short chain dehydrogenase/reductase SDR n=1 Tax=Colletotrichum truncatum TaxID=5467 RepID=A0ACC3ZAZ1_COLTU|nr:short chain dehydrogenase/reductase SDR [Colletotrichum truncatum]KAF6783160.1 short chain dehydrogenase/reductase SDR [Colletotrichum truncatum]
MPTYVITGARGGIGLEYVNQLSKDRSATTVALVRDISADLTSLNAIKAASKGAVHILECDISSEASISALTDRVAGVLGSDDAKIDVLINNAALLQLPQQDVLTLEEEALSAHMRSNVLGPARTLQALLPFFRDTSATGHTVVVNITSGAGSLGWVTNGVCPHALTPYAVSKAGLNMLTVHQAKQLRDRGVVVVAVDPGHVKTEAGGPGATVEVEDSAGGILRLLDGLKVEDSGRFFLYNGTEVPW